MPDNYKHNYFVPMGQFDSQLNGWHTELLMDAEFTQGKCIHSTDTSLKMSQYCPKALEKKAEPVYCVSSKKEAEDLFCFHNLVVKYIRFKTTSHKIKTRF